MRIIIIPEGSRYNKLTVLARAKNQYGGLYWKCRCDCGKTVIAKGSRLRNGCTISCGCVRRPPHKIHGMTNSPEYSSWHAMKKRCSPNASIEDKRDYYDRGIRVCEKWKRSFRSFYADVGPRPANHTIGRIDNNIGYKPGNTRWMTAVEQANNRRSNRRIIVDGVSMTLAEAGKHFGVDRRLIGARLRRGWSAQEAITGSKS